VRGYNNKLQGDVVDYMPLDPAKPGVRFSVDGRFLYFVEPLPPAPIPPGKP
jgi:hypothetical protein